MLRVPASALLCAASMVMPAAAQESFCGVYRGGAALAEETVVDKTVLEFVANLPVIIDAIESEFIVRSICLRHLFAMLDVDGRAADVHAAERISPIC